MSLPASARLSLVVFLMLAIPPGLGTSSWAQAAVQSTPARAPEPAATPASGATPTPSNGLAWRNIGPSVAGGRVTAVSGSDLDPAVFYIGTAGGGVWKSTNGAADWQPVFDSTGSASIGAVALNPHNKDDVWVGTGEAWPRNDVIAGNGVFRSTDGGQTWKHRGLEATAQIARILIDPRNAEHVLVAALGNPFADSDERGVYRSDDGGQTWRRTLFLGRSTGASDIAFDPLHPDIVYAGMWQFRRNAWHLTSGGEADGMFKSIDGGDSWRPVTGNGLPAGPLGRIGLAVAANDANRIYATIESNSGVLWRSDDGANHWQAVSSNTLINERPFYYSRIVVDPHDENHLFSVSVKLAESNDGGRAWHVSAAHVHGDHHDVWFSHDGSVVLEGNDGGPAISRDGGHSWDSHRTFSSAQVYHVGFDRRRPYSVCGGLQDNGTWCAPNATGDDVGILQSDWLRVAGGDGTWVWPDPLDPAVILASSGGGDNGGELTRFTSASGVGTDISPYLRDQNVIAPRDLQYRFNWEAPLAFSPFERDTAYYGANVIFRSTDRGASWQSISPDLTRNVRERQGVSGTPLRRDVTGAETFDTILDIAPSPLSRATLWVGTDDGNVALTRDGGSSWLNIPVPPLDIDSRVVCVEPSHVVAGRAYIVAERHFVGDMRPYIFVTDNFGAAWRPITGNLDAATFVHVIREDPRNPAVLFAGTERGVMWSENRGESWSPFPARLPPVAVRDLRIQPDANDLIAGTHGRGIWIFDDLAVLEGRAAAEAGANVTLFAPREAMLAARDTPTTTVAGAGTGPDAPAILSYYQHTSATAGPTIDIVDRSGATVRHLAGVHDVDDASIPVVPNQPGLNRVGWDLAGDPPTPWLRAPKWNRGPTHGAPVLSGLYSVVLHRDGSTARATIRVNVDRRSVPTDRDELRGFAILNGLYRELSQIDDALNVLDNLRLQLPVRAAVLGGATDSVLATRLRSLSAQSSEIESVFTSQPQNSQDDDFLTDQLRERLLTFINSSSRSSPTAEQIREGLALSIQTTSALGRYRAFINTEVAPLQRELSRGGTPLDLAAKPPPDPKPGPTVDERGARRE